MSLTAPTLTAPRPPAAADRPARGLLRFAGLACALVLASGAARWWQAHRVESRLAGGRESPFPLDSLPSRLGDWVGEKTELDPLIVARTGSNDIITRRYVNQATGVALDVIVMHGPASEVFVHTPTVCYPKAGYTAVGDASDRPARGPDGPVTFRSVVFTKGEPGHAETLEVYFSWRYNGHWTALDRPNLKELQRVSGMYKVQVARRLVPNEARTVDNPSEAFLAALLPELEARIKKQAPPPTTGPEPTRPEAPAPPEGTHR
jgi:hypothetical protein